LLHPENEHVKGLATNIYIFIILNMLMTLQKPEGNWPHRYIELS